MSDINFSDLKILSEERWFKSERARYQKRKFKTSIKKFFNLFIYTIRQKNLSCDLGKAESLIITYSVNRQHLVENNYMELLQWAKQSSSSTFTLALPQFNDQKVGYQNNIKSIGSFGDKKKLKKVLFLAIPLIGIIFYSYLIRKPNRILFTDFVDKIAGYNVALTIYQQISKLKPGSSVYLPLEGNIWEYYLHHMVKPPGIHISSYLNTIIFPNSFSLEQIVKQKFCDQWLDCGSQLDRFALQNCLKIGTTKHIDYPSVEKIDNSIIFLPEGTEVESATFLQACIRLRSLLDETFDVKIRFHPVVSESSWGMDLFNTAEREDLLAPKETFINSVSLFSMSIYHASTSIIEAVQLGAVPIFLNMTKTDRAINDLLATLPSFSVSTVEEFASKIEEIQISQQTCISMREYYDAPAKNTYEEIERNKTY